jgi:hypothetical protein
MAMRLRHIAVSAVCWLAASSASAVPVQPESDETYAAIDGGASFVLAAAFSDAQCHEANRAIAWPQRVPLGVHRVQLSVDVAWLRPMPPSPALRILDQRHESRFRGMAARSIVLCDGS